MGYINRKIHQDLTKDFPFRIVRFHHIADDLPMLHRHDYLEVQLVENGKGTNVIGDKQYELKVGDIYVVNNNEYHHAFMEGEILVFHFNPVLVWADNAFDYEYLRPFYERIVCVNNKLDADLDISKKIADGMHEITEEYETKQDGYRLIIKAHLLRILALIFRYMKTTNHIEVTSAYIHRKDFARIKLAVDYINQNFIENLSLHELSKKVLLNESNFSALFKKVMKKTVTEYITILRVNKATNLLKEEDTSINGICYKSGFKSISQFNKVFKRIMEMSPREYMKTLDNKQYE